MATLIELDRRYRTEGQARRYVPYLSSAIWQIVKDGEWYRLQFTTDRPADVMLKAFSKLYPTHTCRVLEADEPPEHYLRDKFS